MRRAVLAVAALCAAAVVFALGATGVAERVHPGFARPQDDLFLPLALPKLDLHQHLTPGTVALAVKVARLHGIDALVNLSGGPEGGGLEAQLAAARTQGGRVLVFMNLELEGCCDAGWAEREAARLARGRALGARGLAVGGEPGPGAPDATPLPGAAAAMDLAVDAPELDPIWRACAALQLPVVLHGGAPELATVAERHPRVAFVGAHFGGAPSDPAAVTRMMDRLPNVWVDTAGVAELGRHPDASRQAVLAHPDRVLLGTGLRYVEGDDWQGIVLGDGLPILLDERLLGGRERRVFLDAAFRFFETRDARLDRALGDGGEVTGIGLPRKVLRRLYHENAERLLHVRLEELAR